MVKIHKQLGQLFIEAGEIDKTQLEDALTYKSEHNVYLGRALNVLRMVSDDDVIKMVSHQLQIPWINPLTYKIMKNTLNLIGEDTAKRLNVIPLFHLENILTVACADQNNVHVIDELTEETVMEINIVLATERNIEQAIDLHHRSESFEVIEDTRSEGLFEEDDAAEEDHPVVAADTQKKPRVHVASKEIDIDIEIIEAVNMLLDAAIKMGASDVHIDPRERDIRVRFRVDGIMQQYYTSQKSSLPGIISRIKILSGMDIAETRRPQDGRFRYEIDRQVVDLRCATFPTPAGEKMVMRILDSSRGQISLDKLGFSAEMLKQWDKVMNAPHGLVLVTGPTGSGKSTTLYATLNIINSVEVNVLTVEDPIEYQLDNINQSQVNEKAGITFSASLRSMLRLDPDIIMVGEMRDRETIELAIRAALTGHIVFSTLHTNDSASAYTRMLDMGLDAFLVSSTVRAILAQRLVRLLCPYCKKGVKPTELLRQKLDFPEDWEGELYKPVGCFQCRNYGYAGRAGVYELMIPNDEIANLVNSRATSVEIEKVARSNGMITLNESARQYVMDGRTSIEEMMRISLI